MFSRRNLKFLVIIPVVIAVLGLTDLVMALPIGTEVSFALLVYGLLKSCLCPCASILIHTF